MIRIFETENGRLIVGRGEELRPIAKSMWRHGMPFSHCDCPKFNDFRLYGLDYITEPDGELIKEPVIYAITADLVAEYLMNGYVVREVK